MLLLADCICFANPCSKFVVEFRQTVQPKRVQMISRRESFNPQKAWALHASRENKVTDEIVVPHLHGDERHTHLKGDARFLWQHFYGTTFPDHFREGIEYVAHVRALSGEVRLQTDIAARVTLVAIGEAPAAFRAKPKRRKLFRGARHSSAEVRLVRTRN